MLLGVSWEWTRGPANIVTGGGTGRGRLCKLIHLGFASQARERDAASLPFSLFLISCLLFLFFLPQRESVSLASTQTMAS